MTDYCTLAQVREFGKFGASETGDDTLLDNLIDRVSALFDAHCGREIVPDADDTHYFLEDAIASVDYDDGVQIGDLVLDEQLVSITSLTNGDGTTIASTEYFLMPRQGERKWFIRIKAASTVAWDFDTDGFIEVAGKWGYTLTIPEDVRQAAIETVLYFYDRAKNKRHTSTEYKQTRDGTQIVLDMLPNSAKMALERYGKKV